MIKAIYVVINLSTFNLNIAAGTHEFTSIHGGEVSTSSYPVFEILQENTFAIFWRFHAQPGWVSRSLKMVRDNGRNNHDGDDVDNDPANNNSASSSASASTSATVSTCTSSFMCTPVSTHTLSSTSTPTSPLPLPIRLPILQLVLFHQHLFL